MCVSDICDPLTSFCGIGTGKSHDLDAGIHQFIKNRRDDRIIGNIDADHVKITLFCSIQSLLLILGGCCFRCHVLIGDRYAPIEELSLGIFHTQCYRIPPGMDRFIGEIEIIMIFFRLIAVQFMIKVYGTTYRII